MYEHEVKQRSSIEYASLGQGLVIHTCLFCFKRKVIFKASFLLVWMKSFIVLYCDHSYIKKVYNYWLAAIFAMYDLTVHTVYQQGRSDSWSDQYVYTSNNTVVPVMLAIHNVNITLPLKYLGNYSVIPTVWFDTDRQDRNVVYNIRCTTVSDCGPMLVYWINC